MKLLPDIKLLETKASHLAGSMQICDEQLGVNYMNLQTLQKEKASTAFVGFVAEHLNKVVGFTICFLLEQRSLQLKLNVSMEWLESEFDNEQTLGFRKITAVNTKWEDKGIGRNLVDVSNQELKRRGASSILSLYWVEGSSGRMANILKRSGFRSALTIPEYWKEESLATGFQCRVCGKPPCTCTAEIYILKQ